MSLNVRIITPEKVFLSSETEQVVLPSITGGLGVLSGHAPMVTILEAGVLRYKKNGSWTPAVLYGGFAEVENNQVTVLVNGAEKVSSSSNITDVEKALVDATTNLEEVKKKFLKIEN
jgi:F-type H+-transporting ATPase subunit epsilon